MKPLHPQGPPPSSPGTSRGIQVHRSLGRAPRLRSAQAQTLGARALRVSGAALLGGLLLAGPALADELPVETLPASPLAQLEAEAVLEQTEADELAAPQEGAFQAGLALRAIDNDALSKSDDYYTHGFTFSWVSGELNDWSQSGLPPWATEPIEGISTLNRDGDLRLFAHSISQRFFTPSDIEAPEAPADDLPYSGFLYWTGTASSQNEQRLDALSISLGLSGPPALGEEFQNGYHRLIGSTTAKGWDDQLRFEPVINAAYERRERLATFGDPGGWNGDVIGNAQGTLGNLITSATAGITLRAGYRVPDNYRVPIPFLGDETIGLRRTTEANRGGYEIYGFFGAAATGIAHALYLDGNTFESGPSVDRRFGTTRFAAGVTGRYQQLTVTASLEHAKLPFDPPAGVDDDETFVRLIFSWER